MTHRLLLRGPYRDETIASLRDALSEEWTVRVWMPDETDESYAEALAEADATVAMTWSASTPPAPNLKLLQLPGAGWDRLDFDEVPAQTSVCNVFEHEIGIAEYVLATMLMWEIRPERMDAGLRADDWSTSGWGGGGLHGELFGKTLGIVGYGRIGRETARRARAFGMHVRACSRTPRSDELVESCDGMDRLDEMLGASDYVLVSMPLTASNPNLFDADRLAAMRPDGVIINVSRGGLIDEQALYDALNDRRIGGAVIDTWYNYPKGGRPTAPSHLPFAELDNIIMTPHASAWSAGLLSRRWRWIGENLNRLARGEPLENVIRAPGGPAPE